MFTLLGEKVVYTDINQAKQRIILEKLIYLNKNNSIKRYKKIKHFSSTSF